MKLSSLFLTMLLCFAGPISAQTPEVASTPKATPECRLFSEVDLGLLALSGGYSNFFGVRRGPHSFELGYSHFASPDGFGGTPDGFDLTVEYLYSVHYAYFLNGKKDKGLYTRIAYHNKKQIVTEQSSGISRSLYSNLIGAELGYVLYFHKNLYVAPRVGAFYYLQSPQGPDNEPVLVGSSYYDNDRHKTWDTYFIPTVSLGFALPMK